MKKRILHLTLKKKYFDLIVKRKKKEEYRENKPYWQKRLIDKKGYKDFDEIYFRNGYTKKSPVMIVESKKVFRTYVPEYNNVMFRIKLGKILEVKNYKQ
jgi:hypothetical protein